MRRIVVKPATDAPPGDEPGFQLLEPLEDTGLFLADADDPRSLVEGSPSIEWAAPTLDEAGAESYPTGEVSIRFGEPLEGEDLERFVARHALELRRRNEFVPEQVVVAPTDPSGTWLPDVVQRLNDEGAVAEAWPNTRSRYRRES